jgi:hypothetical protein
MFFGVPGFEDVDGAEAEGAGEVHDFDAGVEEPWGEFHGDFRRGGEKGGGEAGIFDGLDVHGQGKWPLVADGLRAGGGVGAVLKEDGFEVGVALEELDELGAGVAAKANDACAYRLLQGRRRKVWHV